MIINFYRNPLELVIFQGGGGVQISYPPSGSLNGKGG